MNTNNMYQENIEKIETRSTYQEIQQLLESGYTWFKRNDLGYGSIQEHFKATDVHIAAIKQHPRLKNLKTVAQVFVITDETQADETTIQTEGSVSERADSVSQKPMVPVATESAGVESDPVDADSFSAFANL